MPFRYDYFPYNDTIATEVYENLYVCIIGVHHPTSAPLLSLEMTSGTLCTLYTFRGSRRLLVYAVLTMMKGAGKCIDQCKYTLMTINEFYWSVESE